MLRKPILTQLAAIRLIETKNWQRGWIRKKENYGKRIGSTADQMSEGGRAGLDSNIVYTNENYINHINYNPKIVKETDVDELAVADTGTTGYYLTLDSPCDNKNCSNSTSHPHAERGNNHINPHETNLQNGPNN